jgi:hypothetical protein
MFTLERIRYHTLQVHAAASGAGLLGIDTGIAADLYIARSADEPGSNCGCRKISLTYLLLTAFGASFLVSFNTAAVRV